MPSNQSSLGALPARFRRPRVLLVGCGDVGLRVAAQLPARIGLTAVTSSPQRRDALRARGIRPLLANLDDPASLRRLAGLCHAPGASGTREFPQSYKDGLTYDASKRENIALEKILGEAIEN